MPTVIVGSEYASASRWAFARGPSCVRCARYKHGKRIMAIETNVAKIKASIKSINTARSKLVDNIQRTALAVAQHAHLHGDITLVNSLAEAVGNGMKATALKLWLLDYAPVMWDSEAKTFTYSKSKRVEGEELVSNMNNAALKPWYDYKTEKKVEEFTDVVAGINSILRKLSKAPPKEGQAQLVNKLRELVESAE